jgi:hypothetical protein
MPYESTLDEGEMAKETWEEDFGSLSSSPLRPAHSLHR